MLQRLPLGLCQWKRSTEQQMESVISLSLMKLHSTMTSYLKNLRRMRQTGMYYFLRINVTENNFCDTGNDNLGTDRREAND